MKIDKRIKQTLIQLMNKVQISGNPDSKEFKEALENYKMTKEFIEKLEEE